MAQRNRYATPFAGCVSMVAFQWGWESVSTRSLSPKEVAGIDHNVREGDRNERRSVAYPAAPRSGAGRPRGGYCRVFRLAGENVAGGQTTADCRFVPVLRGGVRGSSMKGKTR